MSSTKTCDVCWGTCNIINGDGNQQPCWQCGGNGTVQDDSYSVDDDDDD